MASALSARPQLASARTAFFGSIRAQKGLARAPMRMPMQVSRQPQVTVQAFFGLGGSKGSSATSSSYHICIDCGWIYDGDFKKSPGSFRCPACNSPKSRFKVYKGVISGKVNNTGAAMKKRFASKDW